MNIKDLRELEAIYDVWLNLPVEKRESFIQQKVHEHPYLAKSLRDLIDPVTCHDIKNIIAQNATQMINDEIPVWVNEIEKYRITSLIAKGGMGAVYLGERTDSEFEQQVAVKILATHLIDETSKARFVRERQILADFHHPNIAKLLDGGTSREGTPYLIMEYIEGESLDKYCESRSLSLQTRIQLILKVCDAVNYAHQRLIVHRDIKPSNILVDGQGEPILLDFGIAKSLQESELSAEKVTLAHHRVLTPEVASPEQILGQPVTPATDVYGIGILLYRLLTGRYPFGLSEKSTSAGAAYQQLEQQICMSPPPRPSKQLLFAHASKPNEFSTTLKAHVRSIKGDLENIILKSLSKNAADRYSSAQALAEDLRRFLNNEPVLAKPPTYWYLTKKLMQRHPLGALASAATILLLVTIVSIYTVQLKQQRDIAEQQLTTAQTVTQFLIESFKLADPNESRGNQVTARQILDQGLENLSSQLSDEPELHNQMRLVMARVYLNLGINSQAEPLIKDSLNYLENNNLDKVNKLSALAALGEVHSAKGDIQEAFLVMSEALTIAEKRFKDQPAQLARYVIFVAMATAELERFDEALIGIDRALTLLKETPENSENISTALKEKAILLTYTSQYEEAIKVAKSLVEFNQQYLADNILLTTNGLSALGYAYYYNGQYHLAKEHYAIALKMVSNAFGESHPETIQHMSFLASAMRRLGEYDKAEHYNLTLIKNSIKEMGKNNRLVSDAYNNLAIVYCGIGRYQEAVDSYQESLAINLNLYGENSPGVASNYANLGSCLIKDNQLIKAREYLEQSLLLRKKLLQPNHQLIAHSYINIAQIDELEGQTEEAIRGFQRALEIRNTAYGPQATQIGEALARLAGAYIVHGEKDNAKAYLDEAVKRFPDYSITPIKNLIVIGIKLVNYYATFQQCEVALDIYQKIYLNVQNNYVSSHYFYQELEQSAAKCRHLNRPVIHLNSET